MRSPRLILPVLVLSACASPGGPYPSLQPRAAETIDPRVPVERPINDRPVTPALAARLSELVVQAHAGEAAFAPAVSEAERLAASAGAPHVHLDELLMVHGIEGRGVLVLVLR